MLIALSVGLALAYGTELVIRRVRGAAIVYLAAGLENRLGLSLLNKLMAFPLGAVTRSDAYQQRARLRQFEGIRDAMLGPLVQAVLDLPFLILFTGVIFALAPTIGWIVLALGLVNVACFAAVAPFQRRAEAAAAQAQTRYRKMVSEVVENQSGIRRSGNRDVWRGRLEAVLEEALDKAFAARRLSRNSGFVLQSIIMVAGVSGGFQATRMAIEGRLDLGGLVAILILVWRFLMPIQSLSLAGEQGLAILSNLGLIGAVLALPEEQYRGAAPRMPAKPVTTVRFDQVSLRYPNVTLPALTGVSLRLNQEEICVVSGRTMAGKTSLAELVCGLHTPSTGRVLIEGQDIRQMAIDDLRAMVAFCQQEPEVFYGTVAQNLEFAGQLTGLEHAWEALEEAGIASQIAALPDGLETRLSRDVFLGLPGHLQQGLSMAMTFVRAGPIFVFDQPTVGLGPEQADTVRAAIDRRRDMGLVLLISNDPDDLALGDRFVVLDRGRVVLSESERKGREKALSLLSAGWTG